ncbi:hypothetical protein HFO09_08950 [Rhizobium laguerreae]|uniref:hypothetical protein n=1 Tax=Rhizobium laguerreae TaxID=1076926 RepID=UPI001C918571|nr:hypothetical protein [Rhizobium laguerreae]MBY3255811.1 hypothetical protein [Rhizobium laguerreae]MBY3282850.1 hypothetical protein [Rhizobium laguerreae]MBY3289204.1 hypothetical protein [Rhizobium laguerreae]
MKFLAAVLLPTVLAGCNVLGFYTWRWNQKVTVIVETPHGVRTGSSVQSVVWHESPSWAHLGDSGGWFSSELHGEAAVVEVAADKYLFALLKTYDDPAGDKVFRPAIAKSQSAIVDRRSEIRAENDAIESSRETREIPKSAFPTLVTFETISDPSTARQVDPENLASEFGNGYRLKSIELTITTEPQTSGRLKQVLGSDFFQKWAAQFNATIKDAAAFSKRPFAFRLTASNFVTG